VTWSLVACISLHLICAQLWSPNPTNQLLPDALANANGAAFVRVVAVDPDEGSVGELLASIQWEGGARMPAVGGIVDLQGLVSVTRYGGEHNGVASIDPSRLSAPLSPGSVVFCLTRREPDAELKANSVGFVRAFDGRVDREWNDVLGVLNRLRDAHVDGDVNGLARSTLQLLDLDGFAYDGLRVVRRLWESKKLRPALGPFGERHCSPNVVRSSANLGAFVGRAVSSWKSCWLLMWTTPPQAV